MFLVNDNARTVSVQVDFLVNGETICQDRATRHVEAVGTLMTSDHNDAAIGRVCDFKVTNMADPGEFRRPSLASFT